MNRPRVLVLALDGASPDLIGLWAQQGDLPNLRRLIQHGVSGPLRSTYPPLTGPAWASFMTGKSPGHHGVLEFFRRQEGTYRQVLNSRLNIDGASLWRLLSDAGCDVGVMGMPLAYPPEPVKGFLISGLLTPHGSRDFTYPVELLTELEEVLGSFQVRHNEKYRKNNPTPLLSEQYGILENHTRAALYLMQHKPWDFLMVHFYGSDRMQHEFWHVMDREHPQHDPQERELLGDVVLEFFKALDAAVGQLLDAAGDDTVVIVMSDHGFGPVHTYINLNPWLLREGLLKLKREPGTWLRYVLYRLGLNYATLSKHVLNMGLGRRATELGRARREVLQRRLFLSLNDVDWTRSRIYAIGNFGQLYVNLKGREPQGIVTPGEEYEALLDDLTRRLQQLVDPATGTRVIERIFRRDEIYQGPYVDRAPDLMFLTTGMAYKAMGLSDFASHRIFEPVYGTTGHHRMDGILVCHGPGVFETATQIVGARIQDLAPTILYLMGHPVPQEMDGRVLKEVFTPAFREAREESSGPGRSAVGDRGGGDQPSQDTPPAAGGDGEDGTESSGAYSAEEEAKLMEMLRALGYVT